jgi:hypothetical protein
MDAASGRLVNIERVDGAGVRAQLSDDDRTRLAKVDDRATLEALVEQAFEAGINCVLGADADEAEPAESSEDAHLSRLLLQSLIARSAAHRLLQGELLDKAIVGTLMERAAQGRAAQTQGGVAH